MRNTRWGGGPWPGAMAIVALLGLLIGCSRPAGREAKAPAETAVGETGDGSLYELEFALTDADGRTRHLAEFRGRPFVASMIYTNCTSVCPRVTADLQALQSALPADLDDDVEFVLFSLDPARDTPAALREFASSRHLEPEHWTLLAAGPDDMRTLAAVLGVRFRPDGEGEIAHSALIAVVDREGVIRHRQVGTVDDRSGLVAAVRSVMDGPGQSR